MKWKLLDELCLSLDRAQHANHWVHQIDVEEYSHFEGKTSINVGVFLNICNKTYTKHKRDFRVINISDYVSCKAWGNFPRIILEYCLLQVAFREGMCWDPIQWHVVTNLTKEQ